MGDTYWMQFSFRSDDEEAVAYLFSGSPDEKKAEDIFNVVTREDGVVNVEIEQANYADYQDLQQLAKKIVIEGWRDGGADDGMPHEFCSWGGELHEIPTTSDGALIAFVERDGNINLDSVQKVQDYLVVRNQFVAVYLKAAASAVAALAEAK